MPYIGNKPTDIPLSSSDLVDNIITSAKIVDGAIVNADINASAAIVTSKLVLAEASQAQQETGTETDAFVSPATQHHHATSAKAWVKYAHADDTIDVSYNVSSLVHVAAGTTTINWDTDFSSADYVVFSSCLDAVRYDQDFAVQTTGSIRERSLSSGGSPADTTVGVVAFGDQ